MIVTDERQDVQVGGALETEAFTIKASAKAFQILSSSLYSNPLGAVIRELSTNAYDAHVMVGKEDEPFILKMPNSLDPTFKIRDFGPGLSESEIKTVYTTFFESTKTDSNDVVGCLGLGSKSPFGVSDSFTVTSYYNGTKTVYSAFLNEQRIPSIAKFGEFETDEPNGIEVEVAIKEEDARYFRDEVNKQLKYFKVKPIVQGDSQFEWRLQEEYAFQGKNWKVVENGSYRSRVLQGQIAYPIDTHDMGTKFREATKTIQHILYEMDIIFEVNIGDVNIAPSREALTYDDVTVNSILKYAQQIADELPEQIKKTIAVEETRWNAIIRYSKILHSLGSYYHNPLREQFEKENKITWNGQQITDNWIKLPKESIEELKYFEKTWKGNYRKNNRSCLTDYYNKDVDPTWEVPVSTNMIIFYASVEDKAIDSRVKQYAKDNNIKDELWVIKSKLSYDALKEALGNPEIIKVSDLEKVRRVKKSKSDKTTIVQYATENGWNQADQWETHEFKGELDELEGFYVELDRFKFVYNGRQYQDIKIYVSAAKELELIPDDATVYGLRKMNMKKEHNLINLIDHVKEAYAKQSSNNIVTFGEYTTIATRIESNSVLREYILDNCKPESNIYKISEVVDSNKSTELSYNVKQLIRTFDLNSLVTANDFSKEAEFVTKYYGMLNESSYYLEQKTAEQYIETVNFYLEAKGIE